MKSQTKIWHVFVQLLSRVQLFVTPWTEALQASLSFTISRSLLKLMSIKLIMPSNHIMPVTPFFSCLQSFPASVSFPVRHLFASCGQSTGASASASVLPINTQGWFPLGLTVLISLLSKGLARVFSAPQFESINSSVLSLLYGPTLIAIRDYWKNHSFDYRDLCRQSVVSVF